MSQSVVWPPIGGTSYSVPEASEEDWATLTNYLVALSGAQGTTAQKWASRTAITSPATISSPSDCLVGVNLTTPGPSIVNLPVGVVGQVFVIADMKGDAATNNITVTPSLGQTIAAASSYPININKGAVGLVFTGAGNWSVIFQSTTGAGGAVSRTLITAGTPGYSVFNNDTTGLLSEEQFVNAVRGGLGVNASAFTGYLKATAGVFSASAIAAADLPTGIDAAKIGAGAVSNTEYGYLDGVTGPIQAAIDAKTTGNAPITPGTATKLTYDAKGLVTAGTSITAADLPTGIDAAKIGTGVVSNAEFAFLDGVTGAIQTALDTKVAGQASSVDNEVALFSSTTGKVIKRASGTGIAVLTSGVLATATFDNITPAQASQAGKFLGTNGTTTSWQTVAAGLIGTPKTANYTAVNSDMVQADTTAGSFTVTLPSGTLAASVGILDAGPFFTTNNLIVAPATGQSIDIYPVNDTITFDQNRQSCLFYRAAGSTVWEIQTASNTAVPEADAGVSGYVNNTTQSWTGDKKNIGTFTVDGASGTLFITSTGTNAARYFLQRNGVNKWVTYNDGTSDLLVFAKSGAAGFMTVDFANQAVNFPLIHNLGAGNITSGRYNATPTNVSNCTGFVTYSAIYSRVGNTVTVSGFVGVGTTTTGTSTFQIALPIASNLTSSTDLAGVGVRFNTTLELMQISADAATDKASLVFNSGVIGSSTCTFNFQYEVK